MIISNFDGTMWHLSVLYLLYTYFIYLFYLFLFNYFILYKKKQIYLLQPVLSAELRTIGLCDATDSELSIRHLELTPREGKINFYLSPHSRQMLATKTTACKGRSGGSSDSLTPSDQSDYEPKRTNHCDINVDSQRTYIDDSNSSNPFVHSHKCNISTDGSGSNRHCIDKTDNRTVGSKYHSALNRVRNESIVSRSRSFQEQGVRPPLRNSRFFVNRQHRKSNVSDEFNSDTVSHQNIEITVEDTDKIMDNKCCSSCQRIHDVHVIQETTTEKVRRWTKEALRSPSKTLLKSSSKTPSPQPQLELSTYSDVKPWGSGHMLGRIFRRMRKISFGWRKSRCKVRRGD